MADEPRGSREQGAPHETQRVSTARLLLIVVVFLGLAAYAIWNSDRFQTLMQGVSEQRLSELLQRPVSFRRVDFQMFPPSVNLADVRIGNDPRIPDGPLLSAEEVTIGGGFSLTGGELRFGRVRAIGARIALVQFPDGSLNLPPGLKGKAEQGGLRVRVGELVVQNGLFEFDGRKLGIDAKLEDLAAELSAEAGRNRYSGMIASRRATLVLPAAEPLVFSLNARFRLDPSGGAAVDALQAAGDFGQLRIEGTVEDLDDPSAALRVSGDFHVAEVERLFRTRLGFAGDARVSGQLKVPPDGDFEFTGSVTAARVQAQQFPIENVRASVIARRESLVARIESLRYAGGEATGVFRIENLVGKPQPMTLSLEARGVSLERFFGDLDLPGTGLSGGASLTAALRWGEGGLERANGGATLSIAPGPASSIVRGRHGIPTGGGGALTVVNGRIGFHGTVLRFPSSTVEATGGLQIGRWMPDFDFRMRSRDLSEIDRVFQNFVAAGGRTPDPLGLGGSGEASGHVGRSWSDPEVSAQFSAENARFDDVLFGSVRGTADMRDGAFLFHPLSVYEGASTVSLEGSVRYRRQAGRPMLDVTVAVREYPVARFLEFLNLDFPITGQVSGNFPISGNPPDAVSGGGTAVLDDAELWGQKVPRLSARLALEPGKVELDDVRAEIGDGAVGGRGALWYNEKRFEARAAGDGVPLEALAAVRDVSDQVSGKLSFELTGSGSLEDPDMTVSASLTDAVFSGRPVPADRSPRLAARVVRGRLEGSLEAPGRWKIEATGDPFGSPGQVELSLEASDLAALVALTPLDLPDGVGGSAAATGTFTLPGPGRPLTGEIVVTEARVDAPDHPGLLRTGGPARVRIAGGRVTVEDLKAEGEGVVLAVHAAFDTGLEKPTVEARVTGTADAAVAALAIPDIAVSGRLAVDLSVSGALARPQFNGSIRLEDGHYRVPGYSLDQIEGTLRLIGSGGEIEGLRARVAEGEVFAAGNFRLDGRSLSDFRLTVQGRRVQVRAVPSLRLTVDADLVLSGDPDGNQVRGQVTLLRGTYTKDVELTVSDLLSRTRPGGALAAREPWKERTSLDVRIVSAAALEVRNNLARVSGTVDLTARGTVADPVLLGQILLDEGGRVVFADIRYEIEAGTITFSNTTRLAPFIDVRARAEVKGYDLVVSLVGTWPRITPNFTSDPPLSNDAILGLILSGVPPDTRASADTGGQLVSAAGGVLSGAVTGGLTRRTQQLFRLDRFQIDPVFEGSTLSTFRTTIGKQITQELSVTSSFALDSNRQPIIRIEWQATDTLLVQLVRDENGILTLSFRKRQRL